MNQKLALAPIKKTKTMNGPVGAGMIHFVSCPAEKQDYIRKIMLHTSDKVMVVDLEEVILILARRGYSEIFTTGGKKYLSAKPLAEYENLLATLGHFIRANKSYLINLNHLRAYTKGATCCILMKGCEDEIEVSRRKKKDIVHLLKQEYMEK